VLLELQFIHREIGSLRDENRDQNNEIALLKGMVQSQEGTVYQKVIEEIGRERKMEESLPLALPRKRPARLLPLQLLFDRRNDTDRPLPRRFYGPPTNCTELSFLGYTLNGYYLVKTVNNNTNLSADTFNLETVYCAFKQPDGTFNPSGMEKRVTSEFKPNGNSKVPMNGIHFHVQPLSSFTLSGAITVQFDSILINTKNVFDRETGVFAAPKAGVYRFFFRGMVVPSDKSSSYTIYFHLYRNNDMIGSTVVSTSGHTTGMIEATLQLVRGDRISLKTPYISAGQVILRGMGFSSFSGSLLEELDK